MEIEWERKKTRLVSRFPRLYRLHKEGADGFEIDKGWFPLLERLSLNLTEISLQHGIQVIARDIKQKWGTLCFSYSLEELPLGSGDPSTQGLGKEKVQEAVLEAGRQSVLTCERCGRPGVLRKGRRWRVSCDRCHRSCS